jgi:acetolactate decarboxylase
MAIDERLVGALHLQSMSAADLDRERRRPHETFQTSTIAALLDGAYDGDVTFAELAERGDFGLGTLDGCDGEMIALDGSFLRRTSRDASTRSRPRREPRSPSSPASGRSIPSSWRGRSPTRR